MNKYVVVIDPCTATRKLVATTLEARSCRVAMAECCVYTNDLIYGVHRPDLIILDVMLPMMRGDKKAQLLKAREKSSGIPILLMAALGEIQLCELADIAGADGILAKPFTAEQLLQRVAALCGVETLPQAV